jgi:integrase
MSKVTFTASRVGSFECPVGQKQSFLWDSKAHGLGLRSTPTGKPSYVFQSRYQNKTLRVTIGGVRVWSIPDAREKARELQRLLDEGRDPRIVKLEQISADTIAKQVVAEGLITIGDLWQEYIDSRSPSWAANTTRDHIRAGHMGGDERRRWSGKKTSPGVLSKLMRLKLTQLDLDAVEALAVHESHRLTSLRLGIRMFRTFLRWLIDDKKLAASIDIAYSNKLKRALGKPKPKSDHLLKQQLPAWFDNVGKLNNPYIKSYLVVLLLTGARRNELLSLKWEDVDFQWDSLHIRDKVEGQRVIPLTPYVSHLLMSLKRENEWVFYSPSSATGCLVEPYKALQQVSDGAGVIVTLHGLRRTFKSLSEWQEVPVGVVAQIMGHKPSATVEKHYTQRPLDLLRIHHIKLENWILAEAGVALPTNEHLLHVIRRGQSFA